MTFKELQRYMIPDLSDGSDARATCGLSLRELSEFVRRRTGSHGVREGFDFETFLMIF